MKTRKFLIMLIGVFAIVVMFFSCTSYTRPGVTFPRPQDPGQAPGQFPDIVTTMVEVSQHPEVGERKLKVNFNPKTGKCSSIEVNGIEARCNDERFVIRLDKTYFCTPVFPEDGDHQANTKMYNLVNGGTINVYCGNVKFLTDGADIRFTADSTAGNKQCHNSGGYPVCW